MNQPTTTTELGAALSLLNWDGYAAVARIVATDLDFALPAYEVREEVRARVGAAWFIALMAALGERLAPTASAQGDGIHYDEEMRSFALVLGGEVIGWAATYADGAETLATVRAEATPCAWCGGAGYKSAMQPAWCGDCVTAMLRGEGDARRAPVQAEATALAA